MCSVKLKDGQLINHNFNKLLVDVYTFLFHGLPDIETIMICVASRYTSFIEKIHVDLDSIYHFDFFTSKLET